MYVAKPYVAGTPEALVLGQTVEAFASNLEAEVIAPLLPKHGFDNIDPEGWYPHQSWFNILKDIEATMGDEADSAFVAFGRKVVETAVMPPEIQTIPDVLGALHAIHHLNLKNIPEEEGYAIEKVTDHHYIVYHNTPNPDTAIYGFIWGLAARFKKPEELFVVRQMATNPKPDIARSAFEVKWGMTKADIS